MAKREHGAFMQMIVESLKKERSFALGSMPFIWQIFFFYLPLTCLLSTSLFKRADYLPILSLSYFIIIKNSLSLAFLTTLCCFCIGFPFAYTIVFRFSRYKNIFLFLLLLPFWTNFILHIYAWFFVLEKQGFLNNFLLGFGLIQEPIHFLNTSFATLLMMVYFYLPFMVMPIFASLERFDPKLLEASYDLGASFSQTLRRILIPLTMNGIRAGIFLVYIPSFGEFVIPELMGGNKEFYVGNVISLFVLGEKTSGVGIAFTVLSLAILILSLLLLHFFLSAIPKFLQGRSVCRSLS